MLSVLCGLAVILVAPTTMSEAQSDSSPFDPEETFGRQCAPCHGPSGEGGAGPSLVERPLSREDRLEAIGNGARAMPAFRFTLSEEQIAAVTDYLDVLTGGNIYARQCAPCHGAGGQGGVGPDLRITTLTPDERTVIVTEGSGRMPAFGPTLTGSEIAAVVGYIDQLPGIDLGANIFAQQCAPCHGLSGEGDIGPNLVESDLNAAQITAILSLGRDAMPGFGATLDAEGFEAVTGFVLGLRETVESEDGESAEAGDIGAEVYADNCSACHGDELGGGVGPPLTSVTLSTDEVVTIITEGRAAMPPFGGSLAAEDIQAVAGFIIGEEVGPVPPAEGTDGETPPPVPPESGGEIPVGASDESVARLRRGSEVYSSACQGCHQAGGAGVEGTFPPLVGNPRVADTAYLEETITQGRQGPLEVGGVTYDGVMPAMSTLSDEDVEAVVAYIQAGFEIPAGPAGEPDGDEPAATGSRLPVLAVAAIGAAAVLVLGFVGLVVGPSAVSTINRLHLSWASAWLRTALVVAYFTVATVWLPSALLKTSVVSNLSRPMQDVVGSAAWGAALAVGLLGLWRAQRRTRI